MLNAEGFFFAIIAPSLAGDSMAHIHKISDRLPIVPDFIEDALGILLFDQDRIMNKSKKPIKI